MGDDRSQRVGSALSALVETLIPPIVDEDNASLDERRDEAKALASSIIDGLGSVQLVPFQLANVVQALRDSQWYLMSTMCQT